MAPAFAFSLLATRGGRMLAAVLGLALGLPVLFWIIYLVIPDPEPAERLVRVELEISDARTGLPVEAALVRVYRKIDDRELPEMPAKETVGGIVVLLVRPETAESSIAFVGIDASGYAPFRESLVAMIERGETEAGDHYIEAELTPE